ncbi:hypothetical protein [Caviibacterium pharyngocola]|uniref:Uncharacterized protein n=1 Tax=Caviibacterium pharyngocola TaxID=28159 RepID=A0A2M8RWU0_9PAST|nr:hypothetical protein [Caviibacterium pharyngocola]PJG83344.1 hypothetical protein CVP04_04265 [Caviibacterium pharyngocola]
MALPWLIGAAVVAVGAAVAKSISDDNERERENAREREREIERDAERRREEARREEARREEARREEARREEARRREAEQKRYRNAVQKLEMFVKDHQLKLTDSMKADLETNQVGKVRTKLLANWEKKNNNPTQKELQEKYDTISELIRGLDDEQ